MAAPATDPNATDRKLYALFIRIIREAIELYPNAYFDVTLIGTRPNSSTYSYGIELEPTDKDRAQIPWEVHDAIIHVIWYPDGKPQPRNPDRSKRGGDGRCIKIHADDFNRGIGVVTNFGFRSQHAVGIAGTVKRDDRFDDSNPNHMQRHALLNEDAVVQQVLEFIKAAHDEAAASSYDDDAWFNEDRYSDDDPYDDYGYGDDDNDIDDYSRREIELGQRLGFL